MNDGCISVKLENLIASDGSFQYTRICLGVRNDEVHPASGIASVPFPGALAAFHASIQRATTECKGNAYKPRPSKGRIKEHERRKYGQRLFDVRYRIGSSVSVS